MACPTASSTSAEFELDRSEAQEGVYRPGYRGWAKIENPRYWRRESEVTQILRSCERQAHVTIA